MATATDLPFFLRECDNFPFPIENQYLKEEHGRRAFQLVVSLDTLLKTSNATALLLHVLKNDHEGNIIWLCDDVYLSTRLDALHAIYSIEIEFGFSNYITICHIPSTDVQQQSTSRADVQQQSALSLSAIRDAMDTLLQLLANYKDIDFINIHRDRRVNSNEPFPASLDALKVFVSEAQSPRELCLEHAKMSIDQWRVVAFHCNKNVTLPFWDCKVQDNIDEAKFQAVFDAMKLNLCPAKLKFHHITNLPKNLFHDFVFALGSTTSLTDLAIDHIHGDSSILLSLYEAISRNQGLQKLELNDGSFDQWREIYVSDCQGEFICTAVASHPTLRELGFYLYFAQKSQMRDDLMIQSISSNTVLCDFSCHFLDTFYRSLDVMWAVNSLLDRNRFRPVVELIQQETDLTRRRHLFARTFRSNQVSKSPMLRFMLLKGNSDLLAEYAARPVRQLAVEKGMQNEDLLPPLLVESVARKKET